jgi:hypothetical protein
VRCGLSSGTDHFYTGAPLIRLTMLRMYVILREAPALVIAYATKDDRMAQATCTIALSHLELASNSIGIRLLLSWFFYRCCDQLSTIEGGIRFTC